MALDEDEVRAAARTLRNAGVEAVTVCFLFSYLNPEHEERARDILEEELPGCFITCSSTVSPQFREFERFTTAAMNAFVGPKVRRYVERLASEIAAEGLRADLHIMSSNGGVATAKMVSERPVMTLLSGPAAGVLGGAWTGDIARRERLITFDMGGTSADIGIVTDGRFTEASARDTWIAGYPLLASMIDIHTIGAGGGSIAHVDPGGGFRVGPRSAGAEPGPAAYGRGGSEPTVTDANVVLGRLHRDYFLGGEMRLDEGAAARALETLSERLGLSATEAAEGVLTIVTSNMANAIRSRTVQKGIDPREYALVAFGGAGPLHAVDVAVELGAAEVIVPRYPGITSAMGLLTTDLKYDTIRTEFQVSGGVDLARLNADLAAMEAELTRRFRADGIDAADITFMRGGDLRYVGQGYELRVDFPAGEVSAAALVFDLRPLSRSARGGVRARLRRERDRDRQRAGWGCRQHAEDSSPPAAHGGPARRGKGGHRPVPVPHRERARIVRYPLLRPRSAPGRGALRGSGDHRAAGLDHRHSPGSGSDGA